MRKISITHKQEKRLTLTRVVFEYRARTQVKTKSERLTLTRVVFEYPPWPFLTWTNTRLTLTRVVFESSEAVKVFDLWMD